MTDNSISLADQRLSPGLLTSALGLLLIVGNPGLVALGSAVRFASTVIGLLILVALVLDKTRSSAHAQRLVLLVVGVGVSIELFQLARNQEVFGVTSILFRGILYLVFIAGAVCSLPGGLVTSFSSRLLWRILTSVSLILAGSYGYAIIDGLGAATQVRHVADEGLNPVGVAFVFGGIFVISVSGGIAHTNFLWRLLSYSTAGICIVNILATGSRGALVSSALASATLFILFVFKLGRRAGAPIALMILVGLGVFVVVEGMFGSLVEPVVARFAALAEGGDRSSAERLFIMNGYLDHLGDWMFLGLEGYSGPYPHNIFFELVLRFGVIGFLLSLFGLRYGAYMFRSVLSIPIPSMFLVFGLMVFNLANAQTSLSIEMNRWLIWAIGVSFGLACTIQMGWSRIDRTAISSEAEHSD